MSEGTQRRLAAIVSADVVGYSRLIGVDESGTLAALRSHRTELIDPLIAEHGGRLVKTMGDGLLLEFPSVVGAVTCTLAVQAGMVERNADVSVDRRIAFRIGVNLGDIVIDGEDIHGDGVNVAARLQETCAPGGLALSGVAYESLGTLVDAAFEDSGQQEFKNIARPVQVWRWSLEGTDSAPDAAARSANMKLPDKPSIAVLPFDNMSGDPEQEYFADGLTEDIITTLSKLSGLLVIARNSSFAYKGQARDLRKVATALGVRYVLEGSVRAAGQRVRISVQLIDAADGGHLWADRFDRDIEDVFAIQDEITLQIATELQVQFTEGEQARLRYTTTGNVESWNNWVQGLAYFRHHHVNTEGVGRAREFWEKALALDPRSATLHAMLGLVHWARARFGWWGDRETAVERAETYVRAALAIDSDNGDAQNVRALLLLINGSHDEAVAATWRAIELAPGSADIADFASLVFNFSGRPEDALAQITKAMRLSPIYPSWYLGDLGFANRLLGRYDEAIAAFKEYGTRNPGFGHLDLVIIYGALGRNGEARDEAARLLRARPNFTITSWQQTQFYRDPARLEADIAALREAGLPD